VRGADRASVEDLAASILSGPEARPAAPPARPPRRQRPAAGARAAESQRAERSIQVLLRLAEDRGEKVGYLLALDFLTDINRCAADGSLNRETASRLRERYVRDGGEESHLRNILLAGGVHIPPGSSLTLQESYARFVGAHGEPG
jgi:hypothetical protein